MDLSHLLSGAGHALKSVVRALGDESLGFTPSDPPAFPDPGIPGRTIPVAGIDLFYREAGESGRPPLVYLHGANMMADELFYGPLGQLLAERYHVIAFDRPGYGRSGRRGGMAGPCVQAAIVREGLNALKIQRPVLIGHSWGGAVMLAYAVAYGAELRGAVHLMGWAFPSQQALITLLALSMGPYFKTMRHLASTDFNRTMTDRMIARIFAPDRIPAAFRQFPAESILRPEQLSANSDDLQALNPDMELLAPAYRGLAVPLEIITASSDKILDPGKHGLRLSRAIPAARYTNLVGHGHMAHHIVPQAVIAAVDRLISRR